MIQQIQSMLGKLPGELLHEHTMPAREGEMLPVPKSLHPRLYLPARHKYGSGLYAHQAHAITRSLSGENVALATSTASGKSICFLLPALNALLKDDNACAIFLYPVKALSNDQMSEIMEWAKFVGLGKCVYLLDGDVKGEARREALEKGRLLICTPDIFHTTILRRNNEPIFSRLFANLTYLVLDECHVYDGVFGSHMGMLIRRIRQVCKNHGSRPRYILSSATIGNAEEHVRTITGLSDIHVITEDMNGSPTAHKTFFLVRPQVGRYYSYILNLCQKLAQEKLQFIVFCNSRKEVENYTASFKMEHSKLAEQVMPYRAGYEVRDRVAIEQALREKRLLGVFATSALELGLNLPNLDVCVLAGMPGNQASLLQRAGRVGRRRPGAIIICGRENPFDEYYLRRPEALFSRPIEHTAINLSNENLNLAHYACARVESGNYDNPNFDESIFGSDFTALANRVNLYDYPAEILYNHEPHFKISIRSIEDPVYKIGLGQSTIDSVIGEISYSQLMREAYHQGIYMHMGKRYRVKKIIFGKRQVLVDPRCPFASTSPKFEVFVRVRPSSRIVNSKEWPGLVIREAALSVTERVNGFYETMRGERIEHTYTQPLMRYFVTSGVSIDITEVVDLSHGGIMGTAAAIENAYPILYNCSRSDIGTSVWSKDGKEGHIYLFDTTPGGMGVTSAALDLCTELLQAALEGVLVCDCGIDILTVHEGCIKCVRPRAWQNYPANTRADTIDLLKQLIEMTQRTPARERTEQRRFEKGSDEALLARKNYGQTMIVSGSLVYTGAGYEAVVLSSRPMSGSNHHERLYTIQGANKHTRDFLGSALTITQGSLERWCINCGTESIRIEEVMCSTCGERIA